MDRSGGGIFRIAFNAEQELRADQDALERPFDANVEATFHATRCIEGDQAIDVCGCRKAAIGPLRQCLENLPRACGFGGRSSAAARAAGKEASPAGGVS